MNCSVSMHLWIVLSISLWIVVSISLWILVSLSLWIVVSISLWNVVPISLNCCAYKSVNCPAYMSMNLWSQWIAVSMNYVNCLFVRETYFIHQSFNSFFWWFKFSLVSSFWCSPPHISLASQNPPWRWCPQLVSLRVSEDSKIDN